MWRHQEVADGTVHLDESLLVQRHPSDGARDGNKHPVAAWHQVHKPSTHFQPLQQAVLVVKPLLALKQFAQPGEEEAVVLGAARPLLLA